MPNIDYQRLQSYLEKMLESSAYSDAYNKDDHEKAILFGGIGDLLTIDDPTGDPVLAMKVGQDSPAPPKTLYLYDDGVEALNLFILEVEKDPDVSGKISRETIGKEATNFFITLRRSSETISDTREPLKQMVRDIRQLATKWTAQIPIDNLILDDTGEVNIGGITLRSSKSTLQSIYSKLDASGAELNSVTIKLVLEQLVMPFFGNSAIGEVTVYCDQNFIRLKAEERVEEAVNLLRCFINELVGHQARSYIGLRGDYSVPAARTVFAQKTDDLLAFSHREDKLGAFLPFVLNAARVAQLKTDESFEKLDQMIGKENRTDFEKSLITGVRWLGRAAIEPKVPEKILSAAIALEVLILDGNTTDQIQDRLCRRLAYLLGADQEQRRSIVEHVKYIYNIRSKVAHEGRMHVTVDDAEATETLCRQALKALARHADDWKTKNDFIKWVHEQDYG